MEIKRKDFNSSCFLYSYTLDEKQKWIRDLKGCMGTIPKLENDKKVKYEKEFAKILKKLKDYKSTFRKSKFFSDVKQTSLEAIENVRKVDLAKNAVKSKGIQHVAEILKANTILTHLNLTGAGLKDKGTIFYIFFHFKIFS